MSDIASDICTWPNCAHTAKGQCKANDQSATITALRAEVEDLGNRLHHVHRLWANNEHALRAEVERFKVSLSDAVRQTQEQADEITALRAENEKLRAALRDIIADSFSFYAIEVARAALEERP